MPEQLDDRIRSLVAAAVADAPAPPDIDPSTATVTAKGPSWLRRGAIGLAALLAVGGGYAALQPASNDHDVETGEHPTTTGPAPAPPAPPTIVTAGPNGVTERVGDDPPRTIIDEPFAIALALDDGTFVAQHRSGPSISGRDTATWPKSDTSVMHIDTSGKTTTLFEAMSGFVTLHDFAVVDGRRLLLYAVYDLDRTDGTDELYVLDLDAGTHPEHVGTVGGFEAGTSRLTLGRNGLVVGTSYGSCCSAGNFRALAVPGSPAARQPLPKAADFGLQDGYEDGCICPTGFAVDPDGTAIYWLAPVDDGKNLTVVRASLTDPLRHTEVAPVARFDSSFGAISIDADDDRFVASFRTHRPPMVFSPTMSNTFEGAIATLGPNG
jgi:hypothetical protein